MTKKEKTGLAYALATNLAKTGKPQTQPGAKKAKLTKSLEKKREKEIKPLKKALKVSEGLSDKEEELSNEYFNAMIATNKRSLVNKYGKNAEKMAKGSSIKRAKNTMKKENELKIREAVKSALMNPVSEKKGKDLTGDGKIDSNDYLAARDMAIKKTMSKKELQEDDWMQANDESDMADAQLTSIKQNVDLLADLIDDGEQLDAWVQSKLTMAQDYLQSVVDYLQSEDPQSGPVNAIMEYEEDNFMETSKFQSGDQVKIKPYVGGGTGVVKNVMGHFVVLDNGMSYHEDDLEPFDIDMETDEVDIDMETDEEMFESYKKSLTEKIISKLKK
jgi:hypothetical protein